MKGEALSIALCQMNPTIGAIKENEKKIIETIRDVEGTSDLIVFSELVVTGYPPKDLLFIPSCMDQVRDAIERIAASCTTEAFVLLGAPSQAPESKRLFNSVYLLSQGRVVGLFHKTLLPCYDVFDEPRYFMSPQHQQRTFKMGKNVIACTICEDIWTVDPLVSRWYQPPYPLDLIEKESPKVDLVVNLSASPWYVGKWQERSFVAERVAQKLNCPVVQVNQVGANDDLLFDGRSLIAFPEGGAVVLPSFSERREVVSLDLSQKRGPRLPEVVPEEELFDALVMAIKDYFQKTGFTQAVLGISGGVDSSLSAVLLEKALGAKNVLGMMLTTRYTSQESLQNTRTLTEHLGIEYRECDVDMLCQQAGGLLGINVCDERHLSPSDLLAWQNTQARIRSLFLMGIANREHRLLVCTGNKSEFAQGYSTLYGDISGALSPLGDLLKRDVYRLAKWIFHTRGIIPQNALLRAPTAELTYDQKDSDDLLPYEELDLYLEELLFASHHFDPALSQEKMRRVEERLESNEYKRRQAPFVMKVSPIAFGSGRRVPIVHSFRRAQGP